MEDWWNNDRGTRIIRRRTGPCSNLSNTNSTQNGLGSKPDLRRPLNAWVVTRHNSNYIYISIMPFILCLGRGVKLTIHLSNDEVLNEWNYTSAPPYVFMAWQWLLYLLKVSILRSYISIQEVRKDKNCHYIRQCNFIWHINSENRQHPRWKIRFLIIVKG